MFRMNQKRIEKIKKLNLKWYAFNSNHKTKEDTKLEMYNVLYNDMLYDVDKVIDDTGDYEQIKAEVRISLMHRFWSRSEYEVIVSNWTGYDFEQKIDIWYQLYANLDLITEYLIFKLAPRRYNDIMNTRKDFSENTYL